MAFCRNCGTHIPDDAVTCEKCGEIVGSYYQQMPYAPPPAYRQGDEAGRVLAIVVAVIAIIVIVTVVLAAVLYVMVIGFGGDSVPTPVGSWNSTSADSDTSAKLVFGAFSENIATTDLIIFISENGSTAGSMTWSGDGMAVSGNLIWTGGPPGASAEYYDYNPSGGAINSGDYITLNGLAPNTTYTIELFYIPSDSTISMTGASSSFTTQSSP